MTDEKKPTKTKYTKRIIAAMAVFIIFMAYTVTVIKQDTRLEEPTALAIKMSADISNREYFDIATTRIPLHIITYDPENNERNYTIGANGDTDKIDFGIIPIISSARKQIEVSNDREERVKVRITAAGNISEYIQLEDPEFTLAPGEKKDIIIHFTGAPEETEFSGELDLNVIVPKNGYGILVPLA